MGKTPEKTDLELSVYLVHGPNVQLDLVHGSDEERHYLGNQLACVPLQTPNASK
jgi:hypothetical protein